VGMLGKPLCVPSGGPWSTPPCASPSTQACFIFCQAPRALVHPHSRVLFSVKHPARLCIRTVVFYFLSSTPCACASTQTCFIFCQAPHCALVHPHRRVLFSVKQPMHLCISTHTHTFCLSWRNPQAVQVSFSKEHDSHLCLKVPKRDKPRCGS